MRLVKCHIENFGKLHDCYVDFEKDLNVFYEDNGWGKSTLAAFVRAMFYGLEGERKRDISENERKRYKPWQGGTYGGQLTFEICGKNYLVTRIFHDKETTDEFELRDADTNMLSADYDCNLGEAIFKIDRASFMRTVFIGQNDVKTGATDDINAKIGNITDDTNDINNYKAALERLDMMLNKLNPKRATGSVNKRAGLITDLQRRVQDGSRIAGSVEECEKLRAAELESLEELKRRREELSEKQKEVSKLQTIATKKNEWERLKKIVSDRTEQVDEMRNKFPKEVPILEMIEKNIDYCDEMKIASEKAKQKALTESEELEFERLGRYYALSATDENELDEMIDNARELTELKQQLAMLQLTEEEKKKYQYLEEAFRADVDAPSTVIAKWNERNNRKNVLEFKRSTLTSLKMSEATNNRFGDLKKGTIVFVLGLILVVLGVVLIFYSLPIGLLALLVGGVVATVGLLLKSVAKKYMESSNSVKQKIDLVEEETLQCEREIETFDKEISEYLKKHGKTFGEYSVFGDLQGLSEQFMEYNALKKKVENLVNSNAEQKAGKKEEVLRQYLAKYEDYAGNQPFMERLYSIKDASKQKKRLQTQREEYQAEIEKEKRCFENIQSFLEDCGYEMEEDVRKQLGEIRSNSDEYFNRVQYQKEAFSLLEEFEQENNIAVLQSMDMTELPSLEELTECGQNNANQIEDVSVRIQHYNQQLDRLNEQYEEWEETKRNLEEEIVTQKKEVELHSDVEKAKRFLMDAKEAMTARFSTPILTSFGEYYKILTNKSADAFCLDANTVITICDQGKQREIETQSTGWKDLIGVCLRLALVDTMYEEEKPFLVMDDPFINLDDAKIGAAKEFLDAVAKKYQVIYFTCCDYRK